MGHSDGSVKKLFRLHILIIKTGLFGIGQQDVRVYCVSVVNLGGNFEIYTTLTKFWDTGISQQKIARKSMVRFP
jgi:hypothetical protein